MDRGIREAFDFMDLVNACDNPQTLTQSFQAFLEGIGFSAFVLGDPTFPKLHREDRVWSTTWPDEWRDRWVQKNYIAIDPLIYQLEAHNVPCRWRAVRKLADPHGARVMDEARDFRFNDGLAVSMHAQSGGVVGMAMGTEKYELGKDGERCLHMAAIYYQSRMDVLRPRQILNTTVDKLSVKEKDCLSWVAVGKSDWEISVIQGTSEHTVHNQVKSAMRKLDATTRTQAVTIALIAGVISL
jgi:DNA-binding CsgD family transcriptional regulator